MSSVSSITFNYQIVDGRIEIPYCRQLFDKSDEQSKRQTSGESASLPQYFGCNMVFDMRLRVTFLRRKTESIQSNIAHRE
jgi:hypothetical protein